MNTKNIWNSVVFNSEQISSSWQDLLTLKDIQNQTSRCHQIVREEDLLKLLPTNLIDELFKDDEGADGPSVAESIVPVLSPPMMLNPNASEFIPSSNNSDVSAGSDIEDPSEELPPSDFKQLNAYLSENFKHDGDFIGTITN